MPTATGTFEVELTPSSHEGGFPDEFELAKTFAGDLVGVSVGKMLAVTTTMEGSAGYVAMEKVDATLDGRTGSFVFQHSGTMDRGGGLLEVSVVPDSATGDLAGLSGFMAIDVVEDHHRYEFAYELD